MRNAAFRSAALHVNRVVVKARANALRDAFAKLSRLPVSRCLEPHRTFEFMKHPKQIAAGTEIDSLRKIDTATKRLCCAVGRVHVLRVSS